MPPVQRTTQTAGTAGAALTIGDLAMATGLTPEVLRTWEARHGFPVGRRTPKGHRRFSERDSRQVRDVISLRAAGLSLDKAIARVLADADDSARSLYAHLRRLHPHLRAERLRADTLVALSRAIEDESCVLARRPVLFGAFQTAERYHRSEERWRELDRTALFTLAMADFGDGVEPPHADGPWLLHLGTDEPMRREWSVVCVSESFHAVLTAWERPGQAGRGGAREFEAIWSTDPRAAQTAARLCVGLARTTGLDVPAEVVATLAGEPAPADPGVVEALFGRTVGYLDRWPVRAGGR